MDKENVDSHRVLLSGKKQRYVKLCMQINGTRKQHPESGNSDPKR